MLDRLTEYTTHGFFQGFASPSSVELPLADRDGMRRLDSGSIPCHEFRHSFLERPPKLAGGYMNEWIEGKDWFSGVVRF